MTELWMQRLFVERREARVSEMYEKIIYSQFMPLGVVCFDVIGYFMSPTFRACQTSALILISEWCYTARQGNAAVTVLCVCVCACVRVCVPNQCSYFDQRMVLYSLTRRCSRDSPCVCVCVRARAFLSLFVCLSACMPLSLCLFVCTAGELLSVK